MGLKMFRTGKPRPQGEALVLESRQYEKERQEIARVGLDHLRKEQTSLGLESFNMMLHGTWKGGMQ